MAFEPDNLAWELRISRASDIVEHDFHLIMLGGHPLLLEMREGGGGGSATCGWWLLGFFGA